jgi:hypothetical protein
VAEPPEPPRPNWGAYAAVVIAAMVVAYIVLMVALWVGVTLAGW